VRSRQRPNSKRPTSSQDRQLTFSRWARNGIGQLPAICSKRRCRHLWMSVRSLCAALLPSCSRVADLLPLDRTRLGLLLLVDEMTACTATGPV
jgi:hypothetical protein